MENDINRAGTSIFIGLKKYTNWAMGILTFGWVLVMIIYAITGHFDKDNTDSPNKRSGMQLYTDYLTGCQYLQGKRSGGLTPRKDGQGNHVGCGTGTFLYEKDN